MYHFYNSIKACNSFEEGLERKPDGSTRTQEEIKQIGLDRYSKICQIWNEHKFANISSYVKFYCYRDCDILLRSCSTYQKKFNVDMQINLFNPFNQTITIP